MIDWNGKYYNEHAKAQVAGASVILEKLSLNGSERILDIGSGDGNITHIMSKLVPRGEVIGIDTSPSMLKEAYKNYHSSNLSFHEMDAKNFFFEKPFDIITSFNVLHWIDDHEAVLRNIKRVIKKGSRLYFLMVSGINELIGEVFDKEPWKTYLERGEERYVITSVEQYKKLLPQFGFASDRLEFKPFTYNFETIDHLVNSFMTWLPYQMGIDESECRLMALEMAENIARKQNRTQNILLATPMLWVEAHLP